MRRHAYKTPGLGGFKSWSLAAAAAAAAAADSTHLLYRNAAGYNFHNHYGHHAHYNAARYVRT